MPDFNIDRIRHLIGEINNALRKLEPYQKNTEKQFLESSEKRDSAKYNLIVAIEGAIDICNHIVARSKGRAPQDFADCFLILRELDLISSDIMERLQRMARFRNLLVHLYWKVDDRKVFQILKKDIQDISAYLNIIEKIIS